MKKLAGIILAVFVMTAALSAYASEYTAEEAVDILVPYEDEHIMTRNECMKAMNRIIGVNDNVTLASVYESTSDHHTKEDIDYYSFAGRFADLGITLYDRVIPSRSKDFFFGNEPATMHDIVLWIGYILSSKTPNDADEAYLFAMEKGIVNNDMIDSLNENLTAAKFKETIEKLLNNTAVRYFDEDYNSKYHALTDIISNSNEPDFRYIDVFNNSYKDKFIFIKNNGIYLGRSRLQCDGEQPFIDNNSETMLMPVRWFAELFGFKEVEWNEENGAVVLSEYKNLSNRYGSANFKMKFTNGSSEYEFVSSCIEPYDFEIPAQIIDGHMYVPMRSVCESLMYDVNWEVE